MPAALIDTWIFFALLAFAVPIGLMLVAVGSSSEDRAEEVAVTALIALATAVLGYFATGFALQFGGVAFLSGMPGLARLTAEWSPLDVAWGPGWGLVGLRGFFLRGEAENADVFLLFLSHLPAVTTAVLVVLLALGKHIPRVRLLGLGLLVSGLIYPLFGNWVWGGGWLANLGLNLELGHGFVDAAGSAGIFLLGTLVALSVQLVAQPRRASEPGPARLPPLHFPLFMILGALLALAGWPGLLLSNPLISGQLVVPLAVMNLLFAAAAGSLTMVLYSWFVTGAPNALVVARGTVAGLVAASAGCAFVSPWASLAIGAVAGLLSLLGTYLWQQVLHWDDPNVTGATFGLPALWGLLAVAIFSSGRWGAGWNAVGEQAYLGVAGQGVTGLLVAEGYQLAGDAQLRAQLVGIGALIVVGLALPWLILKLLLWLRAAARPRQVPAAVEGQPISDDGAPVQPAEPALALLESPQPAEDEQDLELQLNDEEDCSQRVDPSI